MRGIQRHLPDPRHGRERGLDRRGTGIQSTNSRISRTKRIASKREPANRGASSSAAWCAPPSGQDFSPLYGLSAAIVADDEELFRQRARPAVEYAISSRTSVFAPYDNADNKQAISAGREVGAPYLGYGQLATLHAVFQNRTPALRALAESKGPAKGNLADAFARWRLTGDRDALAEAMQLGAKMGGKAGASGEEEMFNLPDLADVTGNRGALPTARDAVYDNATKLNLFPAPPDTLLIVDRDGLAPVHQTYRRLQQSW